MSKEDSINKIKEFILNRYKNNLAGIIIFGTANTGEFREGKSDIDTMIFLKKGENIDFEIEKNFLREKLKQEKFATQYMFSLQGIKDYIKERASFSTLMVIIGKNGSEVIYSTPEFEETKTELSKNIPPIEKIDNYVKDKDDYELKGYFKELKGFSLTKALFSHIRRKLQILAYFSTKKLLFEFKEAFKNSGYENNEINKLYDCYLNRKAISKKEAEKYYKIAGKLTKDILEFKI